MATADIGYVTGVSECALVNRSVVLGSSYRRDRLVLSSACRDEMGWDGCETDLQNNLHEPGKGL